MLLSIMFPFNPIGRDFSYIRLARFDFDTQMLNVFKKTPKSACDKVLHPIKLLSVKDFQLLLVQHRLMTLLFTIKSLMKQVLSIQITV